MKNFWRRFLILLFPSSYPDFTYRKCQHDETVNGFCIRCGMKIQ